MYNKPLFWEQGTFLQPQHFQLQDLQTRWLMEPLRALLCPYFWGVRRVQIRQDALASGLFEVTHLEVLLQDGALLHVPDNTLLAGRQFREAWENPDLPLTVWLGLQADSLNGHNVARVETFATAQQGVRFVTLDAPDQVPDTLADGPMADVKTLLYNARLYFGSEIDTLDNEVCLPIAQLVREGEAVVLNHRFAPPCLDIHAVPVLRELFKDVRDTVLSRVRQLEEYKIVMGENGAAASITNAQSIALFTILGVLSRHAPALEHLFEAPGLHPWTAYGALRQLVGELSIFSPELSPLGETSQGRRVLPAYDHLHIHSCFEAAKTIITRLVDALVVGPAYSLRFEPEGDVLTVTLPASALGGGYRYWILARTSSREGQTGQHIKCGALSDIHTLISNALPGIRLHRADSPPTGLPRRTDTFYFAVDHDDTLWREVQNQGKLALFYPNAPEDLLVHLAVISR